MDLFQTLIIALNILMLIGIIVSVMKRRQNKHAAASYDLFTAHFVLLAAAGSGFLLAMRTYFFHNIEPVGQIYSTGFVWIISVICLFLGIVKTKGKNKEEDRL
ncbi:hypothetical protein F9U64_06490 [Gracilibacillus oryzae]|uniref:Uncharacterized protein n=1 Tax=Gracilibacillus oryzae TaxID=1672701 RepID=A0A7C8L8C5_9BACI|nr:hypothetical protein [Gracilibacillus oryzae]KAB8138089.1 hypothetical protein F9U64_06490 [Gracilibacillus oryzae]